MDKYHSKYCAAITKYMSAGLTDTEVMSKWDISRATFYRWKKEHPEFAEAADRGKVRYDAYQDDLGRKAMLKEIELEYPYWRDLNRFHRGLGAATPTSSSGTQINIDTMNVLNQQTNEELLIYIKSKLEEMPELVNVIECQVD